MNVFFFNLLNQLFVYLLHSYRDKFIFLTYTTIYIQYTKKYIYIKFICTKCVEKRAFGEIFLPVLEQVQINFIFIDNVHILCVSCNVKKSKNDCQIFLKEQKQVSF